MLGFALKQYHFIMQSKVQIFVTVKHYSKTMALGFYDFFFNRVVCRLFGIASRYMVMKGAYLIEKRKRKLFCPCLHFCYKRFYYTIVIFVKTNYPFVHNGDF